MIKVTEEIRLAIKEDWPHAIFRAIAKYDTNKRMSLINENRLKILHWATKYILDANSLESAAYSLYNTSSFHSNIELFVKIKNRKLYIKFIAPRSHYYVFKYMKKFLGDKPFLLRKVPSRYQQEPEEVSIPSSFLKLRIE